MMKLPVSVVIPTLGRDLLEQCLRSILACRPGPEEVVVVDQSGDDAVLSILARLGSADVRRIPCEGRGIARAMNRGLAAATHDVVLVTHDDCTVSPDWVEVAAGLARSHPGAIVTGRVLPPDGSRYVPSTKTDPVPHDYTGEVISGVLYPANMVASRVAIQAIGGFDERPGFRVAAEDNDLCYRWLVDGRAFRYEPDLVVWHHDWRSPEQLVKTHRAYARAQGCFYAKHLHAGDRRVLAMLRWDLRAAVRTTARGWIRREPRWVDAYREMHVPLLAGLVVGWREARALARSPAVDVEARSPQR